jgi:signal transduction histidine kinase/CheY-like chemotaxis protein
MLARGTDASLRTVFALVPVAIAVVDDELRYESVNPAFCALTGYSAEELIGQSARALIGAPSGAGGRSIHSASLERKGGGTAQIECHAVVDGNLGRRILAAIEVAAKSPYERSLESLLTSERAARTAAERSNRLKDEFLATLSHELRNPLNAILGWASILCRTPDLPEPMIHGLQAIERNSRLQAHMISDLMDYAGITFGKVRLALETTDPYPVVRAALDGVNPSAQAAGIEVHASLGEEPVWIEADAARLQQIVWNLLSNAIKFSASGGVVELTADRKGDAFTLVVTDHGRGIEAKFLPRIFERFSQQDATTTRSHGGLGLGMAIVKQLTELHGGSIEAFSAGPGSGASFTLTLPLARDEMAPDLSDSQMLRAMDFTGVIALVVEDDGDARELTRRILLDVGATVVEAASAAAALECIASCNANILISDIGMAHQDGYQLVQQLRSLGYGADVLPAIALTAFARREDRLAALAAGFQDHMAKPLDAQTLLLRVASLCKPAATAG